MNKQRRFQFHIWQLMLVVAVAAELMWVIRWSVVFTLVSMYIIMVCITPVIALVAIQSRMENQPPDFKN